MTLLAVLANQCRTRSRISRVSVVIVIAIGLAVAYALSRAHSGDVRVYRAGGQAIFGGGDLDAVRVGAYGFTYPPFAAALFAAISWLPLQVMFAVLTAASALALYVVLGRSAPDIDRSVWAATGPAVLVMTQPVIATLAWGQINLVLAALVLHDLLVRRSGVRVGIAAAIKLTPAVFVLYLVICGRRREARAAVVAFVAASAIGAVVAPTASWRYWTHDVFAGSGVGGFDHVGNQSIRGLAERALGSGAGTAVWLVMAVPLLAAGLVLARRAARNGNDVLGAGIAGVTACLVSPVAWIHHWVWCIPCLARLPRGARAALGALLVGHLTFGQVIGDGYPIVALAAFAVGWPASAGGRLARRRLDHPVAARGHGGTDAPQPLERIRPGILRSRDGHPVRAHRAGRDRRLARGVAAVLPHRVRAQTPDTCAADCGGRIG